MIFPFCTMPTKRKTKIFRIERFDDAHYKSTEAYTRAVDALFNAATEDVTRAAIKGKIDLDKPFKFADYPKIQSAMQKVAETLASRVTSTINNGSKKQWLFACDKNDAFLSSIMDTSKLSKAHLKKLQDRNLDALSSFQERKVNGMDLSQRVWNYVDQYKDQMEQALDVGLGDGRSAQQLARDVKQNLKDPNRLFRRVRDKRGNLVLSKNAKAFHPGQGVYRSSVRNAQRLTRSEINMAYRESDWQRWQTLEFVVGIEIKRSNHEPLCKCDVCSRLIGKYPKQFKFKGFHPQCMCYAIPILADEETFDENEFGDLKAALTGKKYERKVAKNAVIDVPDAFKEWVEEHKDAQSGWKSNPYFIQDNFVDGDLSKGLKFDVQTVGEQIAENLVVQHLPLSEMPASERSEWRKKFDVLDIQNDALLDACQYYGIDVSAYKQIYRGVMSGDGEYWRYDEAVAMLAGYEQQVQTAISDARAQLTAKLAGYRTAMTNASVYVDVTSYGTKLTNSEQIFKAECAKKYPRLRISTASLDYDFAKAIADVKAKHTQLVADANALIANPKGADVAELTRLIAEQPTSSYPMELLCVDIELAIKTVKSAQTAQSGINVPDDWEFIPDSKKLTWKERLENLINNRVHLYGQKPYDDYYIQKARDVLANGTEKDAEYRFNVMKKWNTKQKGEEKPLFESINHLNELRAFDVSKLPANWQSAYKDAIAKINAHDVAKNGYYGVYIPIEKAYNMYKLATMPEVAKIGIDKVSKYMPYNLFDYQKKGLLDADIDKKFFDGFTEFVPLVSVPNRKSGGAYYDPTYKYVNIHAGDSDNIRRLSNSPWYRKGLIFHEFGHAHDWQKDYKSNSDLTRIFDNWRDSINADNVKIGEELKVKVQAIIDAQEADFQKLISEMKTRANDEWSRGNRDEYKRIWGEICSLSDQHNIDRINYEELGAFTDSLQAAIEGHEFISPLGHEKTYFSYREKQLAEFIAHCSENYWNGNQYFKQLTPDLYNLTREFIKKNW